MDWRNCGKSTQYSLMHASRTQNYVHFDHVELEFDKNVPLHEESFFHKVATAFYFSKNHNYSFNKKFGSRRSSKYIIENDVEVPSNGSLKRSIRAYKDNRLLVRTLPDENGVGKKKRSVKTFLRIKEFNLTFGNGLSEIGNWNTQTNYETYNIYNDLELKIEIRKKIVWVITIKVPCIPLDPFPVGSCTYQICKLLKDYVEPYCHAYKSYNSSWNAHIPCNCPILGGTYGLRNVDIEIPSNYMSYISGQFEILAYVYQRGQELGCLDLKISI
ncbi:uncharacterized protein LOC135930615 [Gordionus sp. m RMFG-2023]|uniref:uncharacterized protein LOC135930615 n=1 Tax=Gordionus sp. m RMFG-2023 TaxID=3053472 RepID=UPI0031FE3D42